MNYSLPAKFALESLRLEAVTVCVGFDDMLDLTLPLNHPHLDTMIVVTSHEDRATQQVAKKHGAICVQTDLFTKNGRHFNKGAAINAGFGRFQYHGWRLHLDSDIILPDNFRRVLFNHTHLDPNSIYGADRIDVIGRDELRQLRDAVAEIAAGGVEFPARSGARARHRRALRGHAARLCADRLFPALARERAEGLSVVARHGAAR